MINTFNTVISSLLKLPLKIGIDFDDILCPDIRRFYTRAQFLTREPFLSFFFSQKPLIEPQPLPYIISGRSKDLLNETAQWLKEYGFTYKDMFFMERIYTEIPTHEEVAKFKLDTAIRLELDLFIESSPLETGIMISELQNIKNKIIIVNVNPNI